MEFQSFIGGSYPAYQSVDYQRSINLIPERIAADGGAPAQRLVAVRSPGLALMQTLADSPGRGFFSINGRCFAAAGGTLFELVSPSVSLFRGYIAGGTSPVRFASSGTQLFFVSAGAGYTYDLTSNTLTGVTPSAFPSGAVSPVCIDTYFIALAAGTNQFFISAPLDGLTWSGLDFGSTQMPDLAVALAASHGYLWIFGSNTTVVFQDTGAATFPFSRIPGSQIEAGCAAPYSIATLDNTVFWLGSSDRGAAMVFRADGFLPTRVSHHALEAQMQSYPTVADAVASTYQENGHSFYRLDFPSAGTTWVYDQASQLWHERGWWNISSNSYSAHLGRYHTYCFGLHLVLDYSSGNVYQQSLSITNDNGNPIRWLRAAPHISDGQDWLFYSYFALLMQPGAGLPGGAVPVVFLRWSNDGGWTWSNYYSRSSGATGAYDTRVRWNRLGRGRNRVFEVSGSDPISQVVLMGAELGILKGSS